MRASSSHEARRRCNGIDAASRGGAPAGPSGAGPPSLARSARTRRRLTRERARSSPGVDARSTCATPSSHLLRRLPIGAECLRSGGVHFRVWAPRATHVNVVLGARGDAGDSVAHGRDERILLGLRARSGRGHPLPLPPRRRRALPRSGLALPAGGPARPVAGRRSRDASAGPTPAGPAHGCAGRSSTRCTSARSRREGTWEAAAQRARRARRPRRHVHRGDAGRRVPRPLRLGLRRRRPLRARRASTARPTTSAASSTAAHGLGLGVILDVVYNHLGPDGNYLRAVLPGRTSPTGYETEWGEAINFDGPDARAGARVLPRQRRLLDRRVPPRRPAPRRHAEHLRRLRRAHPRRDRPRGARPRRGGRGDDHRRRERAAGHAPRPARRSAAATGSTRCGTTTSTTRAMVALTGRNEAYYTDYRGTPQELISAVKWGYLYQGQCYTWQEQRRGTPGARPAAARRSSPSSRTTTRSPTPAAACALHQLTSPGRYRAMTALLLLAPGTPMLFQGQEFAASTPVPLLRRSRRRARRQLVREGRAEFLAQFREPRHARDAGARCPTRRPARRSSAASSISRERGAAREHLRPAPRPPPAAPRGPGVPRAAAARRRRRGPRAGGVRAALLRRATRRATGCCSSTSAVDLDLDPAPEPLLAPPAGTLWRVLLVERGPGATAAAGTAPLETRRQLAHPRPGGRRARAACLPPERRSRAGAGEETEEAESRREALRRLGIA